MSSFQPQQLQPQQVQPVVVYPNQQQPDSESPRRHSNGSFGTVFIVLAVIAVVSAIACLLGRLCNRRISRGHVTQKHNHHKSKSQSSQNSRPNHKDQTGRVHHQQPPPPPPKGDIEHGNGSVRKSKEQSGGEHIEFGFDNGRSSLAPAINGKPAAVSNGNGIRSGSRGHVAFENGNHAKAKHHGGGGRDHHDYHGGPRASD